MNFLREAIIAIVSAVLGGLVPTILNHRKDKKKTIENKQELLHKTRPEFKIINMQQYSSYSEASSHSCDLELFVAPISGVTIKNEIVSANYEDCFLNRKKWVCFLYTFKNIGKTAVYSVSVVSNCQKSTCIFDKDYITKQFITTGVLNYQEMLDKRIGPNETFTLKLCYHKDKIARGNFAAIMSLVMSDDNNNYWEQPFFAPDNKLYESRLIPYSEYRENISVDTSIACFYKH